MLKTLAWFLPKPALKSLTAGIFTSQLLFGLPVMGPTWLPSVYREGNPHNTTMTKGEVLTLRKLQNQVLRLLAGARDRSLSTVDLLRVTGSLSVHQLCCLSSLTELQRALTKGKPDWLHSQLEVLPPTIRVEGCLRQQMSRLN